MTTENILLTPKELARVTEGYWENLDEHLDIKFVNFRLGGIKAGDLHVTYNEEDWRGRGNSEKQLDKVFAKGAVAAIVRKNASISSDKPILRVENTKQALKQIGLKTSKQTTATKVLVTGSYGKTGFKTQLYHLLKNQFRTNAVINSANKEIPIWRALASIRQKDEIAIIEVAVPAARRGGRRSRWVKPDICVITEIGLEHISSHGGKLENVIANKAEVVKGLQVSGKVIIPNKQDVTAKLIKEINSHGNFDIYTFGRSEDCNAQLLSQKFNGYGWDVKAKILGEVIEYQLPLLEEYAPMSSLSVLLTAKLLKANMQQSVLEYKDYVQYGSSGHFYQLKNKVSSFYLYDQSQRGEMDAFKSTLQLIARMKPKNNGRKIVILSEFTNLEEADKSIINIKEFQQLIDDSGIDILYTTHYFTEHINVLNDKIIWKNHSLDISNIIPEIIKQIKNDDMVFIRGTLKSNLKKLVKGIRSESEVLKQFN